MLRAFLPACTPEELKHFFGPIAAFYCEGNGGKELLSFGVENEKLAVKVRPVQLPT